MALALYRTYRPGSLAEVIGQEHVTEALGRALDAGRTHHAYLFSGPRGCGKTSTARILARSLNCDQGPTANPCGECRSCVELAPNGPGSMDVVELDAATHRGIDDARDLREKAIYAPAASRYKVYIIDEAHQLTNEAANALLKLVEEPPPHLRFIFATTEPDKIIPTIRSRTFHYGFRLVPARTLAEHLAGVCNAEGVPAEGPALAVVARAGAGSVRDSLSVLGQLLAGAGPEGLTYVDAVASLGLTDAALIDAFVDALAAGSAAAMFGVVDQVIAAGHDPRRFVTDVLDRLRDLIVLRVDPGAVSSGLVDVPDDAGQRMLTQAESMGLAELSRAADLVSAGLGELKGATAPRLQLELLCARLSLPSSTSDLATLMARLERLERGAPTAAGGAGGARTGAPPVAPPRVAEPARGPAESAAPTASVTGAGESGSVGPEQAPARGTTAGGPPRRPDLRTAPPRPDQAAAAAAPSDTPPAAEAPNVSTATEPAPAGPVPGAPVPAGPTAVESAAAPTTAAAPPPAPATVPAPTPPSRSSDAGVQQVREAWPGVLARLLTKSKVAGMAFHDSVPVSLANGALAVAVAGAGNAVAISKRGHDEWLRQALIDVLGLDVSIDVLHDPGAVQGAADPGPTAPAGGPGGAPTAGVGHAAGQATAPAMATGPASPAAPARAGSVQPSDGPAPDAPPSAGAAAGSRGAALVREAATNGGTERAEHADEPSDDDPDLSGADGMALLTRELGARPVGEIDHS